MAMVSSAIFCRDSWSFLFLYFFWTACSSGETICIARDARICRTNSGMISVRITTVRPTIDSTQVQPESGSMKNDSSEWNCTMIHATAHSMGYRGDRKSTRLNSSHVAISYAVFCLKKKNNTQNNQQHKKKIH